VLYTCQESYGKFSLKPGWVAIEMPSIAVNSDFYVFVCTDSPKEGGIVIGYDSSVINEHSEVTKYGKVVDWYLSTPKEKVNWMIRVGGAPAVAVSCQEVSVPRTFIPLDYGIDAKQRNSPQGCVITRCATTNYYLIIVIIYTISSRRSNSSIIS